MLHKPAAEPEVDSRPVLAWEVCMPGDCLARWLIHSLAVLSGGSSGVLRWPIPKPCRKQHHQTEATCLL